jgi:hypothetical protein
MTKRPVFKKCVQFFYIIQTKSFFVCCYGCGKKHNQKIITMLYVVMFGDWKELAHCNAHIVAMLFLRVG